jgi:hypothetical protein
MAKRTPATDVTLSPSLAEILLELVNSYIILLLQAKHRENSLSSVSSLVNLLNLTGARSAQETQWEKPAPKPLYTGTAAYMTMNHLKPLTPLVLPDFRDGNRLPLRWRLLGSRQAPN